MRPEKVRAVEKYIEQHTDVIALQTNAILAITDQPDLIRRRGARRDGVQFSSTLYKLSLYMKGISPADIKRNVDNATASASSRKPAMNLIRTASAIWPFESGARTMETRVPHFSGEVALEHQVVRKI